MIYKRGKRWRVIVYAGRDPITGRKRQKSLSIATRAEAKQAEARLITEVGRPAPLCDAVERST
jgi:Arm DNA-binding domain